MVTTSELEAGPPFLRPAFCCVVNVLLAVLLEVLLAVVLEVVLEVVVGAVDVEIEFEGEVDDEDAGEDDEMGEDEEEEESEVVCSAGVDDGFDEDVSVVPVVSVDSEVPVVSVVAVVFVDEEGVTAEEAYSTPGDGLAIPAFLSK